MIIGKGEILECLFLRGGSYCIFCGIIFMLCFYFVFNVKETPHNSKKLYLTDIFFFSLLVAR